MAQWTPLKRDTLDSLADEFLHNYSRGRTIIAIDGLDGAGKTVFADAFAERLGRGGHAVFRACMDDFHRPRAARYARGEDSPEGFCKDSFDYPLFRRVLVDPFRLGGSTGFVTAAWDVRRDSGTGRSGSTSARKSPRRGCSTETAPPETPTATPAARSST